MATSGGEQVRSRAHPMVPSAPAEECGGLATCACGSAARRLMAVTLWGATGGEDEPRETGWPQRARGWAPLAPWQGAAARPRARAVAAQASAWLVSMADTVVRGREWKRRQRVRGRMGEGRVLGSSNRQAGRRGTHAGEHERPRGIERQSTVGHSCCYCGFKFLIPPQTFD